MTNPENTNPAGLNLVTMAQQALANYVTELVKYEVDLAMTEFRAGLAAATLMDDQLDSRIEAIAKQTMLDLHSMDEDRVKDLITDKISDHESDYDHDEFVEKGEVTEMIEDDISERNLGVVDADDEDFRSAVCAAVRNSLG